MPYKSKRSYGKSRKSFGRKRRSTKKKYARKKTGGSKRLLSRKPGTGRSRAGAVKVVKSLDVSTRVDQKSEYDVTYLNTFTCYPEVSAKDGAFIQSFWANSPNNVMDPTSASIPNDWNTGDKMPISGGQTWDFNGANMQCTIPMQYWKNVEVVSADIEIIATPIIPVVDAESTVVYNPRSLCWLTLGRNWNPFQSAAGITNLYTTGQIMNGRMTLTAITELFPGAPSTSATFKGSFTPKKVFSVADIADREGAFRSTPGVTPIGTGINPVSGAFWNFGFVSAAPVCINTTPPPVTFARGVPMPHNVQVKINYRTKWYNPVIDASLNNPL